MIRKILQIVLVVFIIAPTILGGCKNESDEQVTVKFSYPPYGYDSEKEDAFWKKYISEFEQENPGIRIEQTIESWSDVYTKWDLMMQTGNTADIGYDCPLTAVNYAIDGYLLPVSDIIDDLGGESVFVPAMQYFKYDGEWYGVPHGDASMVLLYRKDILKAAGYDQPPQNWDELVEIACACTHDNVYGLGIFTCDWWYSCQIITAFMKAAGGKMLDESGEVVLNSEENLKALRLLDELVNVYKVVPPSAVSWEHGDPANALGTGQVAMCITWGGFGTLLEEMFPSDYENIGFVQQPVGPGGTSGSWSGTGGFFVFKDAQHPEEAKKFIQFMCRPEISKEWALISGNVVPFANLANDPELVKIEWYKAMLDQSATQLQLGWDYGIVPGSFMSDPPFTKAVTDIATKGVSPEDALAALHEEVQTILDEAASR